MNTSMPPIGTTGGSKIHHQFHSITRVIMRPDTMHSSNIIAPVEYAQITESSSKNVPNARMPEWYQGPHQT